MSHKRSPASRDRREIIRTRIHRAQSHRDGDGSKWPDGLPRVGDYESAGHYHWRSRHKNLAKPLRYSGPVSTKPAL